LDLAPDFDEFCALLSAHHVEYVVIGAYALAFHGAPRFTGDLDLLVRPTDDNGRRVLAAIEAFGFPTAPVTPADIVAGRKVIEMGVPPIQLHVMSAIDGVTWEEVWETRQTGTLGPHAVFFIGQEAFVRNKRAAGRPKDRNTLPTSRQSCGADIALASHNCAAFEPHAPASAATSGSGSPSALARSPTGTPLKRLKDRS
jgi:hypothetical protein